VRAALPARRPLRVLEVGGGAGGGFARWMRLLAGVEDCEFTASDRDPALLAAYREEAGAGLRYREATVPEGFADTRFDVLLARSFWDLLPPGEALGFARRVLAPGGVFYATLTFSGETRFDPPHDDDEPVLAAYHATMPDSRAGERLIEEVRKPGSGFAEIASGRSDWRVLPTAGGYPDDEAFFLETILGFLETEVGNPAREWLRIRRRELLEGTLAFTACQHDLAARRS